MQTSTCRSCGALVRWVTMPGGKSMPVDDSPHPEGNVFVASDGRTASVLSAEERARVPGDTPRYISHFATCTQPERHRKAK